jgi:RNA polymerase sigma-70 factor, ECF subfamily
VEGLTHEFERRLASAKEGDEGSFAELFRSVQPSLLRYLRTLDRSVAEDAASETWLSVVRGLHRFTGEEAGWRAWVFTIAHARLRDAQRQARRLPVPADAQELLESQPDGLDVAECVEDMFSTEAALALIGRLPREQAEVVFLRHVAGLDVAHTASVLGKRPGAVRVAAHRGLRRLAGMLGPGADASTPEACNAADEMVDY